VGEELSSQPSDDEIRELAKAARENSADQEQHLSRQLLVGHGTGLALVLNSALQSHPPLPVEAIAIVGLMFLFGLVLVFISSFFFVQAIGMSLRLERIVRRDPDNAFAHKHLLWMSALSEWTSNLLIVLSAATFVVAAACPLLRFLGLDLLAAIGLGYWIQSH